MSSEIVVAEPINEGTSNSNRRDYISGNRNPFTRSITYGRYRDSVHEPFDSEKLPVSLVSEIQKFLRVANLIEIEQPRVAYLCESSFYGALRIETGSLGVR